ncbi:MAG: PKD domain-containing protein [bacterium]|nr:PKD domain-containing protein [bacterium]
MRSAFLLTFLLFAANLFSQTLQFEPNQVSTYAGSSAGFANGSNLSSLFNLPTGIAADTFGNIYVADYTNNRIRKINSSGIVSTLAGNGSYNFANGLDTNAYFKSPTSVACDLAGNVYVADQFNNRIRKITPAGLVSTYAGSGLIGSDNGLAADARFNFPTGVACDLAGNVYVADQYNHKIRKITPSGIVSTLCGLGIAGFINGVDTVARFSLPTGVACDVSGNVYVADYINNVIRKVTPAGVATTYAGTGTSGYLDTIAQNSMFINPTGLFVDQNGDLFVCDKGSQKIRRISVNGNVSTYSGSGWGILDGNGMAGQYANPYAIVRARNGSLYIADASNNRIRKLGSASINSFTTDTRTPSVSQIISVSGRGLTSNLVVKAPLGFQVSLISGNGFADSLILIPAAGEVFKEVYFRLYNSNGGSYNGLAELKSAGATTKTFTLNGIITCASNSGISPSGTSQANYGQYFSQQFSQTGYVNLRWSISSGSIPSGVTIDSISGLLSGSPLQIGFFTFTIKVNEGVCFQSLVYSVNVTGTPVSRFNYTPNSCLNRDIQFRDSSILDTSWFWSFGDGTFSTLENPFHVYAKDSLYEVSLTINGSGPFSTRFVQIASTPPVPSISATTTCNFVYTFLGAPSGYGYQYLWGFDPGSTGNGDSIRTPNRSYSFNGSTAVNLTVIAQGKCISVASPYVFNASIKKIGVTAGFSIAPIGGDACNNARVITNTSVGSGSVFSYSLNGAAFLPILTAVNLNSLSTGLHSLRLAAHDSSCFDTLTQNFVISNVASVFSSSSNTCNQIVAFANSSTVGFGSASYFWEFGSPIKGTSTLTNPSFDFGSLGNDSTRLTVTSESGCSQSIKQLTNVGTNLGPNPNFTFAMASGICTNRISFTNTTINGSGASYIWDFGDGTFASSPNSSRGYADTGVFVVRLFVNTVNCSLSVSKLVHIATGSFGPSAKFAINNSSQPVSTHSFNGLNQSTYLGAGFNSKYYWDFGDGSVDSTNSSFYNKKYSSPGIYNLTLFAVGNNGCIAQSSQKIEVYQVLKANFGYTQNSCANRLVAFHDSSVLATTYRWEFGDGDTSNLMNPTHLYLRDSVYTVRLTVNGLLQFFSMVTVSTTPSGGTLIASSNCDNVYTFFGAPSNNGYTYLWNFDGGVGGNINAFAPNCTYASSGTKNVSLVLTSYGKCLAFMPLTFSASSINNANFARLSLSSPTGDFCSNSRVLNNLSNSGSVYSYSLDTGLYLPMGTPSIVFSNLSTGYHLVRLRATKGTCVSTVVKEFFISTAIANFSVLPSNCNQVVSFQNFSSSSDNGGYNSMWIFGSPAKDTSYDYSPSYNYVTPGNDSATLVVTASSGCVSIIKKAFAVGTGTTTLQSGFYLDLITGACENKFQFTDTTKGGTNLNYTWDFGDGSSSNLRNPTKSFGSQGTFTVTLTSSLGGCFSTATKQIFISPLVYGPSASFKVSNSVQNLVGNSFNYINDTKYLGSGWIVKHYWKLGDGSIDSINNSIFTKSYATADTFEVKLVVYSSTGCVDSISQMVYVVPVPNSKFGVIENTCSNRQVSFIDSSTLANTYFWEFGDGDTSSLNSPTHLYKADGNYEVSLTINGNLRASKTILVATYPTAGYTYTSNNCKNKFQFMAKDTGDLYRYYWSFSSGSINDTFASNPVVEFNSNAKVFVELLVVAAEKCFSYAPKDSFDGFLGVKAAALISSTDYCGNSRLITNNSTGGNVFQISLDGTSFAPYTTPVNYTNLGSSNHQLRFVASDGFCADTAIQFFKVSPLIGNFTYRSSNCDQSVECFSNVISADASPITYLWNFAGEGTSTEAMPLFVFASSGKKYVNMVASNGSGCVLTYADSVMANSSVGPISTFIVTEIKTTPCQSGFNFASTSPNGTQFYWSFGDGQVSDQGVLGTTFHAYLDTGFYSAVMVAINGLGCSTVSDTVPVYVSTAAKPSPIASFNSNDSVQCLSYQNFNFINTSSLKGAGWISKFTWVLNGSLDTISNSIYGKKFPSLGVFNISLTATTNLGCTNTVNRKVKVVADSICAPIVNGLYDVNMEAKIKIYPNPNSGQFTLDLNQINSDVLHLRIIDVLGREVYKDDLIGTQKKFEVNVSQTPGNYFIEIGNPDGEKVRKSFVIVN